VTRSRLNVTLYSSPFGSWHRSVTENESSSVSWTGVPAWAASRFVADYNFNSAFATQVASSEYPPRIERAIAEGINPDLAAFTIVRVATELMREGTDIEKLFAQDIDLKILHAVKDGKMAKEAIKDVFLSVASGTTLDDAIKKLAPAVTREELEGIVRKIIAERADFVAQKQKAALGPLMGVVMAEVRGSVDGKVVSEILRRESDRVLSEKEGMSRR
jgi:glutamyl-tRNA(Gln) amidotransferase subunit E